jgi:hypothetical protein
MVSSRASARRAWATVQTAWTSALPAVVGGLGAVVTRGLPQGACGCLWGRALTQLPHELGLIENLKWADALLGDGAPERQDDARYVGPASRRMPGIGFVADVSGACHGDGREGLYARLSCDDARDIHVRSSGRGWGCRLWRRTRGCARCRRLATQWRRQRRRRLALLDRPGSGFVGDLLRARRRGRSCVRTCTGARPVGDRSGSNTARPARAGYAHGRPRAAACSGALLWEPQVGHG